MLNLTFFVVLEVFLPQSKSHPMSKSSFNSRDCLD